MSSRSASALGALTGGQAVEMVRAGLEAIYVSGWQVAADANLAGQTYPDQSLYPSNSVPQLVRRINHALRRADQIDRIEGRSSARWMEPIVADAEAGFGGPLHAFELTTSMIEAGAAGGTSRTSSRPRRSADTWAARCSCPPRSSCGRWSRPGSPPTCWGCPR